jgi:hypothetical protein
MRISTYLLFLLRVIVADCNHLVSYPKHEFGTPSQELIALYHSGFLESFPHELSKYWYRSPLVKMNLKSKRSCLNVDNLVGLESIACSKNQIRMTVNKKISISHWNISNGVTFLVNPVWNCMGNRKAVFLHSEACLYRSDKELIFNVSQVHPSDVIDEYEFIIRPNNEYHRSVLLYDRVMEEKANKSTDHRNPFNFSYNGNLFDSRTLLNRAANNYFQISCDACSITGTTELSAHIRGSSLLSKAHAILETRIGSALNLNLSFIVKSVGLVLKALTWKQNIFNLNLFAWSIPGIIEPGI